MNFTAQRGSTHLVPLSRMPSISERIHPDDAAHIKQTYRDFLDGKLKYIKTEFGWLPTRTDNRAPTGWKYMLP